MDKKNKSKANKGHKMDTDRYELAWHEIDGGMFLKKSVWATSTSVGPGNYNSGCIDYISNRNDVIFVNFVDDGWWVTRQKLDRELVKFEP